MFFIIKGTNNKLYRSNKVFLSMCLTYLQNLKIGFEVSNGEIIDKNFIFENIVSGIDINKKSFLLLETEQKEDFIKKGFFELKEISDKKIESLLKNRTFLNLSLLYEENLKNFEQNPRKETAKIFINSFVYKQTYFNNLKNRYKTKVVAMNNEEEEEDYTKKGLNYRIYLTRKFNSFKKSEIEKLNKFKNIISLSAPIFVEYTYVMDNEGVRYGDGMECGVQEVIEGLYNQDISKKAIVSYIFKKYFPKEKEKTLKLLRKHSKQYKNYFYNDHYDFIEKELIYELEHKTDVMLDRYIVSLSINIPFKIVVNSFLRNKKTNKEIFSSLSNYYDIVKKEIKTNDYFFKIFNLNFIKIYNQLDTILIILTQLESKFGEDLHIKDLLDKEILSENFNIKIIKYRTDNNKENSIFLKKIKENKLFNKIHSLFKDNLNL